LGAEHQPDEQKVMKTTFGGSSRLDRGAYERGVVMVIALLFLVIVSILGTFMFRSLTIQERVAGNTRDKLRAFEAAQSALQYGEWWLAQSTDTNNITCGGATSVNANGMRICDLPLSNPTSLPWSIRTDYTPPTITVAAGGGLAASGDINYRGLPGLHVAYLGTSSVVSGARLYRVTAFGYGGNADTAAVVSSTYQLKAAVEDKTGPN
jgi:type IV pilus assembly protein PilX